MSETPLKKLTAKQQRFVDCYDGNATEAARQAGYKGNDATLAVVGAENLRKPNVIAEIRSREEKRQSNKIATREERQAFWTDVLRGDVKKKIYLAGEVIDTDPLEISMKDRLKAAELLGKSEGDFKLEVTGKNGGPIATRAEIVEDLLLSVDGATRGLPAPRDTEE
ncbi:MAG: terminase small subunit [Desulfobacterium sp.]|nr:terminase small subunit [Desulfobacterium sp.]